MIASILITLLLLLVFGGVAFVLWWFQGLWGCIIAFVNVLFAASLAGVGYGPIVSLLRPQFPSYVYLLDFIVLWGLFCTALFVAGELARLVSRTAVPFNPLAERIGAPIVALLTGWIVMSFTAFSLHTAPLPRAAVSTEPGMFAGLSPDRGWMAWSIGAATKPPFGGASDWFRGERGDVDGTTRWYAERRGKLEAEAGLRTDAPLDDPAPAAAPPAEPPAGEAPPGEPAPAEPVADAPEPAAPGEPAAAGE